MTDNGARDQQVRRDAGMTLPEVLISVLLTGLLIASMTMAITVVFKQRDNTEGRLNNARSEQNVGIWMPSDLSSAEIVNTDADASPCGASCPAGINIGGSNALMLTWTGSTVITIDGVPTSVPTETNVSYRYMQSGAEWIMVRVECLSVNGGAPSCEQRTVLRGLDPPPPGIPGGWVPGQTKPYWVMVVSEALDPADIDGTMEVSEDPTYKDKNGQRVVVTINGGGDVEGLGGGTNQISLSAGGTERHSESLDPNDAGIPPSFIAARSRCGGNYGMLIDTSGSIGSTNMGTVRTAVTAFINAFAGTPIKLQLVDFDAMAHTLGGDATSGVKYFDMLKETDVADLKLWVNGGGTTSTGQTPTQLTAGGGTNWEDGLNRMFRKNDGTIQISLPKTMIFFTDGEPTMTRMGYTSGSFHPGTTMGPTPTGHPDDSALTEIADGNDYAQVAWNRANRIAREFGAQVNFIGVFVGAATNASNNFVNTNVGYHLEDWERGHHINYERGAHDGYQRGNNVVWERGYHTQYERNNNVIFERSSNGLTYERKSGSSWSSQSAANYFQNNTTPDSTDNWRVRITGSLGSWVTTNMTQTTYDKTNTTTDSTDGFRVRVNGSLSSTWSTISAAQYNASNTTSDQSDGWRATKLYTAPFDTWESTTKDTYGSNNSTPAETDGWRTRQTSSSWSWTEVSADEYNASNTTSNSSDGWRPQRLYTAPFVVWENSTQSAYDAGNSNSSEDDGWRALVSYTSPYTIWQPTDEASFIANNTGTDPTDGSDGWRATKIYIPPYTGYDATQTIPMTNNAILGKLINPAGIINPEDVNPADGVIDNPQTANMYATEDWARLQEALTAIALGECGGTLTLQTKLTSGTNAPESFVYERSTDNKVVDTSATKRSGTFDFPLAGGGSVTVQITPHTLTNLSHYSPATVPWTCKAGGLPVTPTIVDVPNTPWDAIELTISANQAVSCIQNVVYTP